MKLLFWKSFDSECRQINGMKNNWFSFFSEMIFRFLENENEMVKKVSRLMFGRWFGRYFFLIFLKASPENISNFRHFIGILTIWETIWETGDDFCQKSIYSGKKIKSFFLVLESFKNSQKRSPDWKSISRMFVSKFKHFIGVMIICLTRNI